MKDRVVFFFYIAFVVLLTSIHSLYFLVGFALFLFLLSFREFFILLRKTVISIFLFNSFISISYVIFSILENKQWLDYVLLLNLRVFCLTYLTFFIISKINLFNALSFSKTLTFLLVLSYSQILNFQKNFFDFKLALKSRTIEKPTKRDIYNYISSVFFYFFNKSLKISEEISKAMKSRGFFND